MSETEDIEKKMVIKDEEMAKDIAEKLWPDKEWKDEVKTMTVWEDRAITVNGESEPVDYLQVPSSMSLRETLSELTRPGADLKVYKPVIE